MKKSLFGVLGEVSIVVIDSTNLTFEQTVDAIKKLIVQRAAALSLSI